MTSELHIWQTGRSLPTPGLNIPSVYGPLYQSRSGSLSVQRPVFSWFLFVLFLFGGGAVGRGIKLIYFHTNLKATTTTPTKSISAHLQGLRHRLTFRVKLFLTRTSSTPNCLRCWSGGGVGVSTLSIYTHACAHTNTPSEGRERCQAIQKLYQIL